MIMMIMAIMLMIMIIMVIMLMLMMMMVMMSLRVFWCPCLGRLVQLRMKPLWRGSESAR